MAERPSIARPALGISPIEVVCHQLLDDLTLDVGTFDVDAAIAFIAERTGANVTHEYQTTPRSTRQGATDSYAPVR